MATFNRHYTTSELLNLLKRGSLIHYYWSYNNGLYTFYFIDNRRCPKIQNGTYFMVSHRANYYRLRNKIYHLPFRLILDSRSKTSPYNYYLYQIVPDSVFLNEGSSDKLKFLNKFSDGKQIVNVVVI